jgi:DNA-3-methyladenine glycosylase II
MSIMIHSMSAAQYKEAVNHLRRVDSVITPLVRRVGPCRLRRAPSYFIALVEAIVWQQLSWKAACAIHQRMLDVVGSRRPTPADFLQTPRVKLMSAGLSARKAEYLLGVADYFDTNAFPARKIRSMGDEQIVDELTSIRGIGRWSAEMFLIFALNRPDVFPVGDLGLRKAIGRLYGATGLPDDDRLAEVSEPWRPYRTVATWYLWAGADGIPFQASAPAGETGVE